MTFKDRTAPSGHGESSDGAKVITVDKEQAINSPQRKGRRVLLWRCRAESIRDGGQVYSLQGVNETGTEEFLSETMLGSWGR